MNVWVPGLKTEGGFNQFPFVTGGGASKAWVWSASTAELKDSRPKVRVVWKDRSRGYIL